MNNAGLKSIEELKEELNISDVVFEGVKADNGWKAGRAVGTAEFRAAVRAFLDAPVDGRADQEEAKG